ncbi:expressed unknown protein [Seminavis robusta]|uniref:Uncharacterized protein n=1 Tax=Seminavis robusta TaxID=568900 RepID=A0A9N8EK86_9STRA|nr:expressed unknown protein [Seminavis robusta]|eukprot:Sro1284_g259210.1 n/a (79) ;mRNA; f:18053-18289
MDMFPYGKIKKALHFHAVKTELLFRGVDEATIDAMGIRDRVKSLRQHETGRVADQQEEIKTAAEKAFTPLSAAMFPQS